MLVRIDTQVSDFLCQTGVSIFTSLHIACTVIMRTLWGFFDQQFWLPLGCSS